MTINYLRLELVFVRNVKDYSIQMYYIHYSDLLNNEVPTTPTTVHQSGDYLLSPFFHFNL